MSDVDLRAERAGKFRVLLHRPSRSLECEMQGLWSREDGVHFCSVVEEGLAQMGRNGSQARVLFDISHSRIQLFTAMSLPRSKTMIVDGDKVAVVVTSSLLRLSMKQQPVLTRDHAYFGTRADAQGWLRDGVRAR